jgi:hypothetical protein
MMTSPSRRSAPVAIAVVMLLWASSPAFAQGNPRSRSVASVGTSPGSIAGVVEDERGLALSGALVSVLGPTTAVAVTDRKGRFELQTLPPGAYLLRAQIHGFVTPRAQVVDVKPSGRTASSIALRRIAEPTSRTPILAATMAAGLSESASASDNAPESAPAPADDSVNAPVSTVSDDQHDEVAWRLRHARRGVLKSVTLAEGLLAESAPPTHDIFSPSGIGAASSSQSRAMSSLFGGTVLSGQVKLLTAGSFDTPQQLLSADSYLRGIAYLSVGAPVADADWVVRAALMQGDFSSWIIAGAYTSRVPSRHLLNAGMSYSTQRYDDANLAPLRDVVNGSRNVGVLYGYDTFAITPAVSLNYGSSFANYDYLETPGLISPRAVLTLSPREHLRVSATVSRRALAPGAEEFAAPSDDSVMLPPQRAFSAMGGRPMRSEVADHLEARAESEVGGATVTVRAFRQQVRDQLVALFGIDAPPASSARFGRYLVGNAGNLDAGGWGAGIGGALAPRVHASMEYTFSSARLTPSTDLDYLVLLAPSAARGGTEAVHDVHTKLEALVPETSTRLAVFYRVSNAFAVADEARSGFDSRFDVQVRQSLPFMDFGGARWEMLFAVRNQFRESSAEGSVYDELLVVRPPKRVVGGLTVKF